MRLVRIFLLQKVEAVIKMTLHKRVLMAIQFSQSLVKQAVVCPLFTYLRFWNFLQWNYSYRLNRFCMRKDTKHQRVVRINRRTISYHRMKHVRTKQHIQGLEALPSECWIQHKYINIVTSFLNTWFRASCFNVNKKSNLMQQYADIYLLQSHSYSFLLMFLQLYISFACLASMNFNPQATNVIYIWSTHS